MRFFYWSRVFLGQSDKSGRADCLKAGPQSEDAGTPGSTMKRETVARSGKNGPLTDGLEVPSGKVALSLLSLSPRIVNDKGTMTGDDKENRHIVRCDPDRW
jgi:hypothetical protein